MHSPAIYQQTNMYRQRHRASGLLCYTAVLLQCTLAVRTVCFIVLYTAYLLHFLQSSSFYLFFSSCTSASNHMLSESYAILLLLPPMHNSPCRYLSLTLQSQCFMNTIHYSHVNITQRVAHMYVKGDPVTCCLGHIDGQSVVIAVMQRYTDFLLKWFRLPFILLSY